jgi:DUF971 family protein
MSDKQSTDAAGPLGDSECVPVSIERDGDAGIVIQWSDGAEAKWTAARLREMCPCATCREKKKRGNPSENSRSISLPVLSAAEAQPLRIESMQPVGSYAYNIAFSDGHSSGIFPFAMLREIG